LVLLATILLALWAYFVVLNVILSRTRLKETSTELLRERMRRAVRHSLELRVGTNILFARLKKIGADYWPLPLDPHQAAQYAFLRTDRQGYLVDIHLDELEAFIERLPWNPPAPPGLALQQPTLSATAAVAPTPSVWFLKKYGDRVTENDAILRLERSSFGALDEDILSQSLSPLVKIRATDEF
jgi:hypothetical protein